jgi:transposase-like protein
MTSVPFSPADAPLLSRPARRHATAAQRRAWLDQWSASGLSGPAFAARHDLNYQTLAAWRRRAAAASPADGEQLTDLAAAGDSGSPMTWLEAVAGSHDPVLIIDLPGGARLSVTHTSQTALAAQLLQALASRMAVIPQGPALGAHQRSSRSIGRVSC